MSDPVLDALRRNLANSDPASQADKVKRIKARIAKLEKAEAPKSEAEPASKSESKSVNSSVTNLAAPNKGNK